MEVLEAVQARHSVRDFLPAPVPKELVMKILEIATRSPSSGNGQPWELFVASGAALEAIRCAYMERAYGSAASSPARAAGPGTPPPPAPASTPPAYIRERMSTIRTERMKLLGLDPSDTASGKVMTEFGARLYGVPALVLICMDKALSSNFDLGMLAQTICLVAQHFGVDSIIAGSFVTHRDVLRKELDIPETLDIVIGVGLGYANPKHIINTYRSPRRPIEEVVRYKG